MVMKSRRLRNSARPLECADMSALWNCASPGRAGQCRAEEKRRHVAALQTAAFTLAEVLAALMFMAIVVPVAVECLQTASRWGIVAERKGEAARVAQRVLSESLITTNWNQSDQSG